MPGAGLQVRSSDVPPDAWTSWTVSYVNLTVGDGTVTAAYMQTNSLVVCRYHLVWGSTTSYSSTPQIVLPVTPNGAYTQHDALGTCYMYDSSGGSPTRRGGTVVYNASSQVFFSADDAAGSVMTATVPWTWATSDVLAFTAIYEAA